MNVLRKIHESPREVSRTQTESNFSRFHGEQIFGANFNLIRREQLGNVARIPSSVESVIACPYLSYGKFNVTHILRIPHIRLEPYELLLTYCISTLLRNYFDRWLSRVDENVLRWIFNRLQE